MLNKFLLPCQLKKKLFFNIQNLIVGDKYQIRGSFKRDVYVVDVDVENNITTVENIHNAITYISFRKLPNSN